MIHEDVRQTAQKNMAACKACPVCNGFGCRGKMPGPGGRDGNENFIYSYEKLRSIKINVDFIHDPLDPDTRFNLFGQEFSYPVFAAPIGMLSENFGPYHSDDSFAKVLLEGCEMAGIAGFVGDGPVKGVFQKTIAHVKDRPQFAVPTIKNWPGEKMQSRIAAVHAANSFALATDIDCIGLVKGDGPFTSRNASALADVIKSADRPVILKGIMTRQAALEAARIGAAGIVVSTHGGRLIGGAAAPIEVLPEIADAVKGKLTILIDGAIRTGSDVFSAIALGADAVLVGRPFVVAAYGGGAQGVAAYANALGEDLRHVMRAAGVAGLNEIGRQHIRMA